MAYTIKSNAGDSVSVPYSVISRLAEADEGYIKIALYILSTGCLQPEKICEDLHLPDVKTVNNALLWWNGAGLLEQNDVPVVTAEKKLSWAEIEELNRNDPAIACLINQAQNTWGRSLGHSEMQKLVGLYIQDGYDPEVIMLCLIWLAQNGKKTVGSLSHALAAWQAEGVHNGVSAETYLHLLENRKRNIASFSEIIGIPPEGLTQGAKTAISRWYEKYQFSDEMVHEAVLQAGPNKDVWYINGILKNWHEKGYRTIHDVRGNGTASAPESRNIRVDKAAQEDSAYLRAAMNREHHLKRKDQ